jgi:hypothetical protein
MSHDRTYDPQIHWIEPELSPRMRAVVKPSLAVAAPQTHGDDFMRLRPVVRKRSTAYSEEVPKENIVDNAPKTTTDVKATDLPPVPTN